MPKVRRLRWRPTGEQGRRIGKDAEVRFVSLCASQKELGRYPEWLIQVYAATRVEDADGIDAWAETVEGRIPIQIKRSRERVAQHQRNPKRSHILCIECHPDTRPVSVFMFLISQLQIRRRALLTTPP